MTEYFLQIADNKIVGNGACMGYTRGGVSYPITEVGVTQEVFEAYCRDPESVVLIDGVPTIVLQ